MNQISPLIPESQNPGDSRTEWIKLIEQIFPDISEMDLPLEDFSTARLQKLAMLVKYSIHPIYSSEDVFQIYIKVSEYYWHNIDRLQDIKELKNNKINTEAQLTVNVSPSPLQNEQVQTTQQQPQEVEQQVPILQEQVELSNQLQASPLKVLIQAEQKPSPITYEKMVSKSYSAIKLFLEDFCIEKSSFMEEIKQNVDVKAPLNVRQCCNPSLATATNILKNSNKKTEIQKNFSTSNQYIKNLTNMERKDSTVSQSAVSAPNIVVPLIIGKNQSTQMKQIKHMLKIQAKTSFVESKLKQQDSMETLQKKTIELNYFLNVMTKQFFQDFCHQIRNLVIQNVKIGIVQVFCQKIIQKSKEQHTFIDLYADLVKRLSYDDIRNPNSDINTTKRAKKNYLQILFVEKLQYCFFDLIESNNYSSKQTQAEQIQEEFKFRKGLMGLCMLMGKMIKFQILPRKVFKMCFWEMCHQYVERVKDQSSQCQKGIKSQIINESLLQGIVIISQSMGDNCNIKQIIKQRAKNNKSEISFQKQKADQYEALLTEGLLNHDQERYLRLMEDVDLIEFPYIMMSLLKLFSSRRMKLLFLVEGWQQKMNQYNINSVQQQKQKKVSKSNSKMVQKTIQELPKQQNQNLVEISHTIVSDRQVKSWMEDEIKNKQKLTELIQELKAYRKTTKQSENWLIRNCLTDNSQKFIQKFVTTFLLQFADTTKKAILVERISFFFTFCQFLHFNNILTFSAILDAISLQLQQFMMVDCDLPYLAEGLAQILVFLVQKANQRINQQTLSDPSKTLTSLMQMKSSIDADDEDTIEFWEKVVKEVKNTQVKQQD